jgi:hypothetical protein
MFARFLLTPLTQDEQNANQVRTDKWVAQVSLLRP